MIPYKAWTWDTAFRLRGACDFSVRAKSFYSTWGDLLGQGLGIGLEPGLDNNHSSQLRLYFIHIHVHKSKSDPVSLSFCPVS